MSAIAATSASQAVSPARHRRVGRVAVLVLALLLLFLVILSAGVGALPLSVGQVIATLLAPLGISLPYPVSESEATVFWLIRLPRVVFATFVGAALATAGAGLQGVFRNPLADPSLLGISACAALGAGLLFVFGGAWMQQDGVLQSMALPVVAFAGALMATYALLQLARVGGKVIVATMLLAGIAITAFAQGGVGALTYLATDTQLRSLAFWQLGSLGGATWTAVLAASPFLLATIIVIPRYARTLNLILLGDAEARHLGVNVDRTRKVIFTMAALGVAASVAFAGSIGFVGLVVPHLLRLVLGPDNRYVVGLSPLLGASLLLGADLVSRTIAAPAELPIGIVTAAVGAPFFLWLVVRQRASGTAI